MRRPATRSAQRGASLVVGLIMLTLITVLVTSSFSLSATNLKAVGNMQVRNEAVDAANMAIEQELSSPFTTAPTADTVNVDIDNDGTVDYQVAFNAPSCVSGTQVATSTIPPSSLLLGSAFASTGTNYYQTVWDLDANVTHLATGTSVRVHQGVRVLMTQAQYSLVCP
jgi:Tfp pilus assembly protein PilX